MVQLEKYLSQHIDSCILKGIFMESKGSKSVNMKIKCEKEFHSLEVIKTNELTNGLIRFVSSLTVKVGCIFLNSVYRTI